MISLTPFAACESTPSGARYQVTVTRIRAGLYRVSWSLTRDGRTVGGSQTRRCETEAVAVAERTVESLRVLTERSAA